MERWRYPRFFTENISDTAAVLDREDSKHVSQVLRMRPGEFAVICDGKGTDYLGRLESAEGECVFEILEKSPNQAEPSVHLRLFQAMPKGDKMEFVIQKSVELGVRKIVPFLSKNCVSRPDKTDKKVERWRKIAAEAAKQCGRGCLPVVTAVESAEKAFAMASDSGTALFFYEHETRGLRETLEGQGVSDTVSLVVGPEGGFDPEEIDAIRRQGGGVATLGPRILRCETAPLAALTLLMHLSGNME